MISADSSLGRLGPEPEKGALMQEGSCLARFGVILCMSSTYALLAGSLLQ